MAQLPTFLDFFATLETVDVATLEENDTSCDICLEEYSSEHSPVRLPCSHIFVSYPFPTLRSLFVALDEFSETRLVSWLKFLVLIHMKKH